jgi:hypothetical protein
VAFQFGGKHDVVWWCLGFSSPVFFWGCFFSFSINDLFTKFFFMHQNGACFFWLVQRPWYSNSQQSVEPPSLDDPRCAAVQLKTVCTKRNCLEIWGSVVKQILRSYNGVDSNSVRLILALRLHRTILVAVAVAAS